MASKDGGGGGAFGWTVLGFLAGVAATLAMQTLFGDGRERVSAPQASITHITTVQAEPAGPSSRPVHAAASSRPAAVSAAAAESQDEVADDAAAAGMTSRAQPQSNAAAPQN